MRGRISGEIPHGIPRGKFEEIFERFFETSMEKNWMNFLERLSWDISGKKSRIILDEFIKETGGISQTIHAIFS